MNLHKRDGSFLLPPKSNGGEDKGRQGDGSFVSIKLRKMIE